MPSLDRRSDISGDLANAVISRRIASMIGSGVPAGAEKPFHEANSKPGTVSATAGMSGAAEIRLAVPTAISLILSLLMCGSSADELPK